MNINNLILCSTVESITIYCFYFILFNVAKKQIAKHFIQHVYKSWKTITRYFSRSYQDSYHDKRWVAK
jgi:hypothetical protein